MNIHSLLFVRAKRREASNVCQLMDGQTKCSVSVQWSIPRLEAQRVGPDASKYVNDS